MSLDKETLRKVAHLARLALPEEDIETYTQNISDILQLVEKMNEVDTSDVAPMAHPLDLDQPMRSDEVTEENRREKFLHLTHDTSAGLYLVPKVIEAES